MTADAPTPPESILDPSVYIEVSVSLRNSFIIQSSLVSAVSVANTFSLSEIVLTSSIFLMSCVLGQPLNCILQPHPKIMTEHQVVVGSHKEISLERRRRIVLK